MLEKFIEMIEAMATMNLNETPNMRFLKDFRTALLQARIPIGVAEMICVNAEVNLTEYDPENPLFKRFLSAYPQVIDKAIKAWTAAGFLNYEAFVKRTNLKIEF